MWIYRLSCILILNTFAGTFSTIHYIDRFFQRARMRLFRDPNRTPASLVNTNGLFWPTESYMYTKMQLPTATVIVVWLLLFAFCPDSYLFYALTTIIAYSLYLYDCDKVILYRSLRNHHRHHHHHLFMFSFLFPCSLQREGCTRPKFASSSRKGSFQGLH